MVEEIKSEMRKLENLIGFEGKVNVTSREFTRELIRALDAKYKTDVENNLRLHQLEFYHDLIESARHKQRKSVEVEQKSPRRKKKKKEKEKEGVEDDEDDDGKVEEEVKEKDLFKKPENVVSIKAENMGDWKDFMTLSRIYHVLEHPHSTGLTWKRRISKKKSVSKFSDNDLIEWRAGENFKLRGLEEWALRRREAQEVAEKSPYDFEDLLKDDEIKELEDMLNILGTQKHKKHGVGKVDKSLKSKGPFKFKDEGIEDWTESYSDDSVESGVEKIAEEILEIDEEPDFQIEDFKVSSEEYMLNEDDTMSDIFSVYEKKSKFRNPDLEEMEKEDNMEKWFDMCYKAVGAPNAEMLQRPPQILFTIDEEGSQKPGDEEPSIPTKESKEGDIEDKKDFENVPPVDSMDMIFADMGFDDLDLSDTEQESDTVGFSTYEAVTLKPCVVMPSDEDGKLIDTSPYVLAETKDQSLVMMEPSADLPLDIQDMSTERETKSEKGTVSIGDEEVIEDKIKEMMKSGKDYAKSDLKSEAVYKPDSKVPSTSSEKLAEKKFSNVVMTSDEGGKLIDTSPYVLAETKDQSLVMMEPSADLPSDIQDTSTEREIKSEKGTVSIGDEEAIEDKIKEMMKSGKDYAKSDLQNEAVYKPDSKVPSTSSEKIAKKKSASSFEKELIKKKSATSPEQSTKKKSASSVEREPIKKKSATSLEIQPTKKKSSTFEGELTKNKSSTSQIKPTKKKSETPSEVSETENKSDVPVEKSATEKKSDMYSDKSETKKKSEMSSEKSANKKKSVSSSEKQPNKKKSATSAAIKPTKKKSEQFEEKQANENKSPASEMTSPAIQASGKIDETPEKVKSESETFLRSSDSEKPFKKALGPLIKEAKADALEESEKRYHQKRGTLQSSDSISQASDLEEILRSESSIELPQSDKPKVDQTTKTGESQPKADNKILKPKSSSEKQPNEKESATSAATKPTKKKSEQFEEKQANENKPPTHEMTSPATEKKYDKPSEKPATKKKSVTSSEKQPNKKKPATSAAIEPTKKKSEQFEEKQASENKSPASEMTSPAIQASEKIDETPEKVKSVSETFLRSSDSEKAFKKALGPLIKEAKADALEESEKRYHQRRGTLQSRDSISQTSDLEEILRSESSIKLPKSDKPKVDQTTKTGESQPKAENKTLEPKNTAEEDKK